MSEIKKILVPTDFSDSADVAVRYVAHLTADFPEKEVTLVHVANEGAQDVDEKLAQLKTNFESLSKASCSTYVTSGELTETILKYQRNNNQDLIVMGTEGREGEVSFSQGSEMVMKADCPVLLIPSKNGAYALKNIALALDKKPIDDSSSLNVLHGLAREKDAKIHVLTIENDNGDLVDYDTNEGILQYYLETIDYKYVFPKSTDIEKGINDYILKNEIDLLAILPRNHDTKSKPSAGKLTKLLTLHANVPVLAID